MFGEVKSTRRNNHVELIRETRPDWGSQTCACKKNAAKNRGRGPQEDPTETCALCAPCLEIVAGVDETVKVTPRVDQLRNEGVVGVVQ